MNDVAAALGRIASGIYVLTVQRGQDRTGMVSSWVMQASFDPPMFTAAVRNDRYVAQWLAEGARVGLNIVPEGGKRLLSHFGKGFAPDQNAFENIALLPDGTGVPILADALGFLEGRVTASFPTGDHVLFCVTVENGRMLRDGVPMTHVRKNGLRY